MDALEENAVRKHIELVESYEIKREIYALQQELDYDDINKANQILKQITDLNRELRKKTKRS